MPRLFWINRIRIANGRTWTGHGRPRSFLWVSDSGTGSVRVAGTEHRLDADAVIATQCSSLQGITADGSGLAGWFCYHEAGLQALPLLPDNPEPVLTRALCAHCEAAYRHSGGDHPATAVWFTALLQLLAEHNRSDPPAAHHDRIERAILRLCAAIDREPQADWSVAAMARRIGLSSSQLGRRMRRLTDCSPQAYVLDARIALGRSLLRDTDLSIEDIARRCGYRDRFHFSRQFRQRVGTSPRLWRGARRARLAHLQSGRGA